MAIRSYEDGDYAACRDLWRELTERHRLIYDDPGIGGDDPGAGFDDYLALPDRVASWVAVEGGEVIALTGLLLKDGSGEVEPAVVTEAQRSKGIGRVLLQHVVADARERGLPLLSVRPVARNVEAIALFHDVGFAVLGHLDMFMDLRADAGQWKPGIDIHGLPFVF